MTCPVSEVKYDKPIVTKRFVIEITSFKSI